MRLTDIQQDAAANPFGALGYADAARYLGVSPRTVRQLVHDGKIRSFAIGSRRLINVERLDEYRLAEEARQTAPRLRIARKG